MLTAIFETNILTESSKKAYFLFELSVGLAWHNQTKRISLVPFRFFAGDGTSWMDQWPNQKKDVGSTTTNLVSTNKHAKERCCLKPAQHKIHDHNWLGWLLSCKLTWMDSSLDSYAYHPHISEFIHKVSYIIIYKMMQAWSWLLSKNMTPWPPPRRHRQLRQSCLQYARHWLACSHDGELTSNYGLRLCGTRIVIHRSDCW